MSNIKKKKLPKTVKILTALLIFLCILPFIVPNPFLQQLNELEENVIEPHFSTFLDGFEIIRVNVDRYQDTEDTRTYEVFVKEQFDVGNGTFSNFSSSYIIVIKDGEEVVSTTRR